MTTTIEAPATSAGDSTVLQHVLEGLDGVHAAAEEILWRLEPGQLPSANERKILRLAGIEDRNDLDREVGRVGAVKRRLEEAGSRAEFDLAGRAAMKAVREENERRPDIEAKIAELQAELDQLAAARESAQGTLQKFNRARDALRTPRMLPGYIRDTYEADVHVAGQTQHQRIGALEITLRQIEDLGAIATDPSLSISQRQQRMMLHAQSAAPHLIGKKPNGSPYLDTTSWSRYVASRAAERPAIELELHELREQRDAAIGKVDRLRDYYVDQIT